MAVIVFVHGMSQENSNAAEQESIWVPALAEGLRATARGDLADGLLHRRGALTAQMAFYGDVFLGRDFQGSHDDIEGLGADQYDFAIEQAEEWLRRAAERDGNPDQIAAQVQLAALDQELESQGPAQELGRLFLNGLSRLKWFAQPSFAFAQRHVNKSLRQVSAYVTNPAIRDQVNERVSSLIGPETRVIIGHSLGSVVAYQVAANVVSRPLPALVTMGSPLGLRSVIYPRLQPQPPAFPPEVRCWTNVADRNDLVAAEPDLGNQFTLNKPDGAALISTLVSNGNQPHSGARYLAQVQVGLAVAGGLA